MAKLLLVDDQVLFVESLRSVLQSRSNDFTAVAVAYDGRSGVNLAMEMRPDIVLMDIRMPGEDGFAAAREIREKVPGTKIIMLTTFEDDQYLRRTIETGAIGYLLKDVTPDVLISALRAALNDVFLVTPAVAQQLATLTTKGSRGQNGTGSSSLPEWYFALSRKERQMLRLVIEGYDNDEIAKQVYLATQTVRNYLSRIYEKVGVHGRLDAIKMTRSFIKFL